jgi:hypothetical protein
MTSFVRSVLAPLAQLNAPSYLIGVAHLDGTRVKSLPCEMRSIFHWGEAYLTEVHLCSSACPVAHLDGTGAVNKKKNNKPTVQGRRRNKNDEENPLSIIRMVFIRNRFLNKQSAIEGVYILGNGYHCDITVYYITSLLWSYVVRKYIQCRFFLVD